MWGKPAAALCAVTLGAATWACEGEYRQYTLPLSADAGNSLGAAVPANVANEPGAFANTSKAADAGATSAPGVQADAAVATCTPRGPRDCASSLDNDCDGQPDDTIDETCRCVPASEEPCDEHAGLDGRGQCRPGSRTCVLGTGNASSDWGACQGSVGPEAADSCAVRGDDSDCDGTPNGGCPCVEGETTACGPSTDEGLCQRGTSSCLNGAFGTCQGAVFPAPRNCASPMDNDCDGRPDNTVDAVCTCVIGDTQVCGEHPGQDGVGRCVAGERRCEVGAGNATSRFGACTGSIGPAAQDSCTVPNDDSNCDGFPNAGCACIAGQGNAPCSGDAANSRCNAQGQCGPCQTNADCSLLSGGRTLCAAGQCIARQPDGSPCQQALECLSNQCREQFPNADGDQFPDLRGDVRRLCGNAAQAGRAFARADGQSDCCDADARAFPGALPPRDPPGFAADAAGFALANACGSFDYDCRDGATSSVRQARLADGDVCNATDISGLSNARALELCGSLRGWVGGIPACGETGTLVLCGVFGGVPNCVNAAAPSEQRLCF